MLVVPRALFVEVGHFLRRVAAFDEVAGTFHEEDAGYHHSDSDGGEQVYKHSDEEDHDEHHSVGTRNLRQVAESFEVDNSPTHGDEDASQDRQRHILHEAAESKQDGEE